MKAILIFSLFLIISKPSYALECMGCEISDSAHKCGFFYNCKDGIEMCETLVSKVNGNYTITMSCATKERCGTDSVYEEGFQECKHKLDDTECYSCCDHDQCNTLSSALKRLPKNIFPESDEEKISKIADDAETALEQGETYDEDTNQEKNNSDYEESESESENTDEVVEESEEQEEEDETPKKSKKGNKKVSINYDQEEEVEEVPETTTIATTEITETTTEEEDFSTTTTSEDLNSTTIETSDEFSLEAETIPKLNIDGTQIAFNPNFTNTDTTVETTTERELEIGDIADMIFPENKNISTDDEEHVGGTNEAFEDVKGTASLACMSFLLLCLTALTLLTL